MLISSFLPSTGGQGPEQSLFSLTVRQKGQDSLRQAILITKAMKSKSKKLFQRSKKLASSPMVLAPQKPPGGAKGRGPRWSSSRLGQARLRGHHEPGSGRLEDPWKLEPVVSCEKISPAILINKKCHSHH